MIVETRKTAQGTEYWDNKEKRVLFVPAGKKPEFDVTTEYKSMIGEESEPTNTREPGDGINLEDMTISQLREFAKQVDVEIPSDIKKKDDIIDFLADADSE